ncbi:hypothetical protein CVT24_001603 [Panaeolus cyanescens]|uniref:Uncharacterized protein n=1 Tax=Panaeolus cyanescens TaxID=181874 RepID=A0A409YFD1_9AGAR|nr:hypothetical protein CVT24_001603 [Panaeolus cyanescens]
MGLDLRGRSQLVQCRPTSPQRKTKQNKNDNDNDNDNDNYYYSKMQFPTSSFITILTFAAHIHSTYALQFMDSVEKIGDREPIIKAIQAADAAAKTIVASKPNMDALKPNTVYVKVVVTTGGDVPSRLCGPDRVRIDGFCIGIKRDEFKGKDLNAAVELVLRNVAEQSEKQAKKNQEAWKVFRSAVEEKKVKREVSERADHGVWLERRTRSMSSGSLLARRSRVIKNDEK